MDWLGQRSFWFPISCHVAPAKRPVGCRIDGWCLRAMGVYPLRLLGFDSLSSAPQTAKSAEPSRFLHSSYPKPIWRTDGASGCHAPRCHGQQPSSKENHDVCAVAQLGKPGIGKRIRESAGSRRHRCGCETGCCACTRDRDRRLFLPSRGGTRVLPRHWA